MIDITSTVEDLDSKLIFARFGDLVRHQRALYQDYNEIDEADEINRDWLEFSKTVVEHLLSVQELTESLYQRITDEVKRREGAPVEDDLEKLKNITAFWLDTAVMSYLYTTIQKSGVLKQKGLSKKPIHYYLTKHSLNKLLLLSYTESLFFDKETLQVILEIMKLDQIKNELDLLDEIGDEGDRKKELLENYDRGQAGFLLNIVRVRIAEGAVLWWWKDPIAMHSAVEHGMFHLENMRTHWDKIDSALTQDSKDYYEGAINKVKLMSNVYLAQHYRKLGEEALKSAALGVASEYFTQAADIMASAGEETLVSVDFVDAWSNQTIQEQYITYGLAKYLTKISLAIQKILKHLKDTSMDPIEILIDQSLEQVQSVLKKGDQPYLSSIALMFETILAYLKTQINNSSKRALKEAYDFVNTRLEKMADRIESATGSLLKQWNHAFVNFGSDLDLLKSIIKDIDLLKLSVMIVPMDYQRMHKLHTTLESMSLATEAHSLVFIADETFGKNPVKELLIRAKTIQLAYDAINCCSDVAHGDFLQEMNQYLLPIVQYSLNRGLIAEVQLRRALQQYNFVNKIAQILENSNLLKGRRVIPSQSKDIEELDKIKNSAEEIAIACETLDKVKAPVKINGSDINFAYFTSLAKAMKAFSHIISLLKESMIAYQPSNVVSRNQVINAFDKAGEHAFEAANYLGSTSDDNMKKLAEQIYTIGQMFNSVESQLRAGEKLPDDFPLMPILSILQQIVM